MDLSASGHSAAFKNLSRKFSIVGAQTSNPKVFRIRDSIFRTCQKKELNFLKQANEDKVNFSNVLKNEFPLNTALLKRQLFVCQVDHVNFLQYFMPSEEYFSFMQEKL